MQYYNVSPPEEHSGKLKCQHCKFSTESEAGLQVHLARKHPKVRNEGLCQKEKNFKWTTQYLEFLVETMKKEGVKYVNKIAAEILPNSTEAAIQRKCTKQEYKQAEVRVNERKAKHQNAEKTPSKTQLSQIEIPTFTRTPRILPTVLPTPISAQSHRRRSLAAVPP